MVFAVYSMYLSCRPCNYICLYVNYYNSICTLLHPRLFYSIVYCTKCDMLYSIGQKLWRSVGRGHLQLSSLVPRCSRYQDTRVMLAKCLLQWYSNVMLAHISWSYACCSGTVMTLAHISWSWIVSIHGVDAETHVQLLVWCHTRWDVGNTGGM